MPMSARRAVEKRRARQALHWYGIGLSVEEIGDRLRARPKTVKRFLAQAGVQIPNENKGGNK